MHSRVLVEQRQENDRYQGAAMIVHETLGWWGGVGLFYRTLRGKEGRNVIRIAKPAKNIWHSYCPLPSGNRISIVVDSQGEKS